MHKQMNMYMPSFCSLHKISLIQNNGLSFLYTHTWFYKLISIKQIVYTSP